MPARPVDISIVFASKSLGQNLNTRRGDTQEGRFTNALRQRGGGVSSPISSSQVAHVAGLLRSTCYPHPAGTESVPPPAWHRKDWLPNTSTRSARAWACTCMHELVRAGACCAKQAAQQPSNNNGMHASPQHSVMFRTRCCRADMWQRPEERQACACMAGGQRVTAGEQVTSASHAPKCRSPTCASAGACSSSRHHTPRGV